MRGTGSGDCVLAAQRPSARADLSGERRLVSMEGKPATDDDVVAFD